MRNCWGSRSLGGDSFAKPVVRSISARGSTPAAEVVSCWTTGRAHPEQGDRIVLLEARRQVFQDSPANGVTMVPMSVWLWVLIGVAALLIPSLIVGLFVAAVLGRISREVSGLLEAEPWASAPLMRASERSTQHVVGRESRSFWAHGGTGRSRWSRNVGSRRTESRKVTRPFRPR
jgi:hypothetical protein